MAAITRRNTGRPGRARGAGRPGRSRDERYRGPVPERRRVTGIDARRRAVEGRSVASRVPSPRVRSAGQSARRVHRQRAAGASPRPRARSHTGAAPPNEGVFEQFGRVGPVGDGERASGPQPADLGRTEGHGRRDSSNAGDDGNRDLRVVVGRGRLGRGGRSSPVGPGLCRIALRAGQRSRWRSRPS